MPHRVERKVEAGGIERRSFSRHDWYSAPSSSERGLHMSKSWANVICCNLDLGLQKCN